MRFNREFYKDVFFWGGVLIFLSAMTMVSHDVPKNKQSR